MRQLVLKTWIFVAIVPLALADFTPHFRKFLHDSYGVNMAGMLERTDLGLDASLGGMVYGTTWGDAGTTPVGLVDMKCSYVKQIRSLIIAVRQYTGTQVDVIAYSMGSPIARKAILGGQCVDTREILGNIFFYRPLAIDLFAYLSTTVVFIYLFDPIIISPT
ncbi:unnamed protein product [Strongylus vulgaris]|uniref:Lipase domain-containing protein n=1 Tax=Strongylus vulgaris TaxID=40348 RepID=A0A3P7LY22_STRVU|nr:unnamed protein product [Strongylus vulgaris]